MFFSLPLVFICLVLNGLKAEEEDHVLVLTESNFDETLSSHEFVLVDFYSPRCPHCQSLEPEYKKAASILKEEGSSIILAKVDATEQTGLAEKYSIRGYPTVNLFKQGKVYNYEGDRQAESIVNWVKKKSNPAIKELSAADSVKDFIKSDQIVVVAFLKESQKDHLNIFTDVASEMDGMNFAVVSKPDIFKEFGISKDSQIVVFKQFDEGRVDYTGDIKEAELIDFLKLENVPFVVEFSQSTSHVFRSPVKLHLVAFISKSKFPEDSSNALYASAKKFKRRAHFITVDVEVEDNKRVLEFFSVSMSEVPTYRIVNLTENMSKYKPDSSDFTEPAVTAFVDAVLSKKHAPFLMSEEIPTESSGPVRILVGKNYNEFVRDRSRSVLVMLHAPWCGHCKQLTPKWESLAEEYKDSKDIVIAKMDATANEAEGLSVRGFPTVMFYPKDSDEAIEYSGEREPEAFKKFIESGGKVVEEKGEEEKKDEL